MWQCRVVGPESAWSMFGQFVLDALISARLRSRRRSESSEVGWDLGAGETDRLAGRIKQRFVEPKHPDGWAWVSKRTIWHRMAGGTGLYTVVLMGEVAPAGKRVEQEKHTGTKAGIPTKFLLGIFWAFFLYIFCVHVFFLISFFHSKNVIFPPSSFPALICWAAHSEGIRAQLQQLWLCCHYHCPFPHYTFPC